MAEIFRRKMHNNIGNNLRKFQGSLMYHLREIAKFISFYNSTPSHSTFTPSHAIFISFHKSYSTFTPLHFTSIFHIHTSFLFTDCMLQPHLIQQFWHNCTAYKEMMITGNWRILFWRPTCSKRTKGTTSSTTINKVKILR